jgi:two-component sensor histidine kinase
VKNALATVNDIVELSRDGHTTVDGFVASLEKRIQALKRTHDRLTSTRWAGVALRDLVEDEIEPYRTGGNARLEGPDVILRPKLAQAFALTVHELATNAAKHGALGAFNGKVEVTWRIDRDGRGRDQLSFAWREHSLRSVEPPTRESYGMQAIRSQLAHSHEATVELRFTSGGLECDIAFPLHGEGEPAAAHTVTA